MSGLNLSWEHQLSGLNVVVFLSPYIQVLEYYVN